MGNEKSRGGFGGLWCHSQVLWKARGSLGTVTDAGLSGRSLIRSRLQVKGAFWSQEGYAWDEEVHTEYREGRTVCKLGKQNEASNDGDKIFEKGDKAFK